jgi:hypothetical protein
MGFELQLGRKAERQAIYDLETRFEGGDGRKLAVVEEGFEQGTEQVESRCGRTTLNCRLPAHANFGDVKEKTGGGDPRRVAELVRDGYAVEFEESEYAGDGA